jgi:endonuclease/exonuclease/phosphatase family metal-dependent hydrolase
VFALDRVWVHPWEALVALATPATPGARLASDHLPIVADVALR